jgi:hypothetical protein
MALYGHRQIICCATEEKDECRMSVGTRENSDAGIGERNDAGSVERVDAGTRERDDLLGRLQHMRSIVPVFAQELASARRQAAALRIENRKLQERVQQLHHERDKARHNATGAPAH